MSCRLHHPRRAVRRAPILRCAPCPLPRWSSSPPARAPGCAPPLPKVLHPICGRPMILWPVLAAREAGAARVIVVDNPKRRLAAHLPEGVEVAVQARAARHRRRGRGRRRPDRPGAPVLVINGDMPLHHRRGDRRRWSPAHGDAARGDDRHDGARRPDAATAASSATRDGGVERVVETKVAGRRDRRRELAIREVNAGLYLFDGGALLAALETLEHRQRPGRGYLPDVLPALRAAGRTVRAHVLADPRSPSASTTAWTSPTSRALAQQRIRRGAPARGGDDRRSRARR